MSIPFLLGSRITLLFNARVINNVSVQIKYPQVIVITFPRKLRLDNTRTFFDLFIPYRYVTWQGISDYNYIYFISKLINLLQSH